MGKYASKIDLSLEPVEFDWAGKTYKSASLTSGGWADWRRAMRKRNWLEKKIGVVEKKLDAEGAENLTEAQFDEIDTEAHVLVQEQIDLDASVLCGVIPGMTTEIVKDIPLVLRSRIMQQITDRETKEVTVAEEEAKQGES
jgi:hypothetical protein